MQEEGDTLEQCMRYPKNTRARSSIIIYCRYHKYNSLCVQGTPAVSVIVGQHPEMLDQ